MVQCVLTVRTSDRLTFTLALWLVSGTPSGSSPSTHRLRHWAESAANHPATSLCCVCVCGFFLFRAICQIQVSYIDPQSRRILFERQPRFHTCVVTCPPPMQAVSTGGLTMSQLWDTFGNLLQEKNFMTEQLVTVEEKTGVRREFTAMGMLTAQRF